MSPPVKKTCGALEHWLANSRIRKSMPHFTEQPLAHSQRGWLLGKGEKTLHLAHISNSNGTASESVMTRHDLMF